MLNDIAAAYGGGGLGLEIVLLGHACYKSYRINQLVVRDG